MVIMEHLRSNILVSPEMQSYDLWLGFGVGVWGWGLGSGLGLGFGVWGWGFGLRIGAFLVSSQILHCISGETDITNLPPHQLRLKSSFS